LLIKNTLEIVNTHTHTLAHAHTTSASQNLLYLHNVAQNENT